MDKNITPLVNLLSLKFFFIKIQIKLYKYIIKVIINFITLRMYEFEKNKSLIDLGIVKITKNIQSIKNSYFIIFFIIKSPTKFRTKIYEVKFH